TCTGQIPPSTLGTGGASTTGTGRAFVGRRRALALHSARHGRGRTLDTALLAGARTAARHRVSHALHGGIARSGGARFWRHDSVGHGLSTLVARRQENRSRAVDRCDSVYGRRIALAS